MQQRLLPRHLFSGWISFLLPAVISLVGYVLLSTRFPLAPYADLSPSPDIRSLAPRLSEALLYALLLLALYGLYLLAYRQISRLARTPSPAIIVMIAALYCLPLLFTFPINASDVYRYFIFGRISSVYGESPFTVAATEVGDPYTPFAGEFAAETTPYGPIWELAAAATTAIAPNEPYPALILFKGLASIIHLASAGLIALSLGKAPPPRRAGLTMLYAWNPSLLLIFAMDGHNDGLMLLWLLLGWWVTVTGRRQVGMILMLLAPLTKLIGLLALPYFFLASWRELTGRVARLRFLLITIFSGLALAWLSFIPFGLPLELISRLIGEASSGGGFSPLAFIILQARVLGINPAFRSTIYIAAVLFGLLALYLLWSTGRGRSPLRAAADIFAGYIFQALRFRIWYAAWPFPWLVLDHGQEKRGDHRSRARLAAGLTFLLTSQLSVLVYGQIRTELLDESMLAAHRIGVLFTFLLPLIVGLAVAVYSGSSPGRRKER